MSCDEQNIKLHDYFFRIYIKLFKVVHPLVLVNKTFSFLSCSEQIRSLVPPAGGQLWISISKLRLRQNVALLAVLLGNSWKRTEDSAFAC